MLKCIRFKKAENQGWNIRLKYRRFDARAVERILERHYRLQEDTPVAPLGGLGPLLLGEVEAGSLEDYSSLDDQPSSQQPENTDNPEDHHGS